MMTDDADVRGQIDTYVPPSINALDNIERFFFQNLDLTVNPFQYEVEQIECCHQSCNKTCFSFTILYLLYNIILKKNSYSIPDQLSTLPVYGFL